MRVLFLPMAWPSHYYPMVPLAWAFRADGHDVRVAAQPSATTSVVSSGLTAVSVGASYDLMAGLARLTQDLRGSGVRMPSSFQELQEMPESQQRQLVELRTAPHVRAAETMAGDLLALTAAWRPDLVVADPMVMVAPLVADLAGARLVHHLWGPQVPSLLGSPGAGAPIEQWPADLLALFRRLGAGVREEYSSDTLDPTPDSLQSDTVAGRLPYRYVPYNGPGELPGWLLEPARLPRVCVSASISGQLQLGPGGPGLRDTVLALAGLDAEIVLTVRAADREAMGGLPGSVRVVEEVPLQLLLPGCAAAVHGGGAGSVLTAAWAGLPQVVLPQAPDQMLNGGRLAAVGAGVCLAAGDASPDAVATEVKELLATGGGFRTRAQALAAQIRAQPSPAHVGTRWAD